MTITTTTRSGLTGIKLTEMDILFRTKGSLVSIVQAITPKGYLWIRENLSHKDDYTVTVQREFEEELKQQMRKDGLNV